MKTFYALLCLSIFAIPALSFAVESNDPLVPEQWYLDKIQAKLAWDVETGNSSVVVAVIDSGVDLDHADLAANIWSNVSEIPANGLDDDGNGYIDDIHGWDFVQQDSSPSPATGPMAEEEAAAHGSLVAGLIGAVGNNGVGVAGVAWTVDIMALRALNNVGSGSSLEVAEAIYYAIDNGADVVNLSFSGTDSDALLSQAVQDAYEAGVVVVAALGNENMDTDLAGVFPSCYRSVTDDWVIGVASTNKSDEKAVFSNYGEHCADIAAPGVDMFGVNIHEPDAGFTQPYLGGWTGTSMSSPLVAGTAALLLSAYPDLTPEEVRIAMQLGVDPVAGTFQSELGTGRLNVARALEVAASLAGVGPPESEPTPEPEPEREPEIVDLTVNDLVPGDFFKAPSFPDVYVYTETGGRSVFINHSSYFTYTDSFDGIIEIDDADLARFRLDGLVLPKAGVVLVKIQSLNTVYALMADPEHPYQPVRRAIADEAVAAAMFGTNWADFVIDVDPSFFTQFGIGEDINSPEVIDISIMKTREALAALAQ